MARELHFLPDMHRTHHASSWTLALLAAASLAGLSGCGEAGLFSRAELATYAHAKLGSEISPNELVVEYRSTRCDAYAEVACPRSETPNVDVFVNPRSIIFDFSNIEEARAIADTHFEGFVFERESGPRNPILFASIDSEVTTVDLDPQSITFGDDYLELNLAGVALDPDGLIKVDLLVGPLNVLGHGQ